MPVPNGILAVLPAEEDLTPVSDGGKVDESRSDVLHDDSELGEPRERGGNTCFGLLDLARDFECPPTPRGVAVASGDRTELGETCAGRELLGAVIDEQGDKRAHGGERLVGLLRSEEARWHEAMIPAT